MLIQHDKLRAVVRAICAAAGSEGDEPAFVADNLVDANLTGHDSHGVGMLPRGEVGLVFAAIGRALGVLDDALFSAIVLMVIVTTLIAPPWLKAAIRRQPASAEEASA